MVKNIVSIFIFFCLSSIVYSQENKDILEWSEETAIPNEIGLNGSYSGIHNDVLIIAGGANFPNQPVWEGGKKHWHDEIYVLEKKGGNSKWIHNDKMKLPKAMANGISISTPEGLLCIGGDDENTVFNDVFLLKWNKKSKTVEIENLPVIPVSLASMGASQVGDIIYLVGGKETKNGTSTSNFISLNLKATLARPAYTWKKLPDFPGKSRLQAVTVGQSNGHQDCLYVFSGVSYDPNAETTLEMLDDVYEYDPHKVQWTQKGSVPNNGTPEVKGGYISAAPAIEIGDSHILIFGGAGGENQHLSKRMELWSKLKTLKNIIPQNDSITELITALETEEKQLIKTTSFSKTIWAYHTITDTWSKRGELKDNTQVVTKAISWNGDIIIPGGEIRPGVRTNKITKAIMKPYEASFGLVNYVTLIVYLILMVLMGWYFSRRNKTTDDFFLAGGRIPWWAAGLSIYATMLSAITYLSQPALAYSFDWQAYLGYFAIILVVPIVITFYLPFYRKLNITTAYEYLEKRFHVSVRMFGSISFVLFQLVRMGIVVYLPALALSTVVGMDIYMAIIVMGILAVLYTYMGGMEAVIWTDVVQVIVLMAGLIIGLVFIAIEIGL